MAYSIPPLDFSRSPNSFYTVSEVVPPPHDDSTMYTGSSEPESLSRSTTATSMMTEDHENEGEEPRLEHRIVDLRRIDSASSISSPRGKLVNRQVSMYGRAWSTKDDKKGWQSFRCDIHPAANSSYSKAETECKQAIITAGGEIDASFVYLGGFFYRLPGWVDNPLKPGHTLIESSRAKVDRWTPFPRPVFDRFKLKPYHATNRVVTAERRRTIAGPEHLLQDVLLLPKTRQKAGRRVVSSWLGMLAKDYGKGVSYLA
ncbi:hypothetical protein LTR78_007661 [Recurvomyces mirabilis]|uniref:Uncharacterized protein n=1 Tax=Recurvomyces mirabilis TaxID=574656 RepID=A0AAE0TRB6_9PEZI|nr:hypothetical protein LTR78_007661 [Recurvomyces mirabilis]KAK5151548.1 hypothetical protein LTS14_009035 [Recurvomyces mirabilis]